MVKSIFVSHLRAIDTPPIRCVSPATFIVLEKTHSPNEWGGSFLPLLSSVTISACPVVHSPFANRSRCSSRLGPRMARRRSRTSRSRATPASEEMVVLRRQASAGWSHQIADGGAVGFLVRPNEASCKARDISRQASETQLSIAAIWHPHTPAACWFDRPLATVRISASRRSSLRRPKIWRNSSGS